MSTLELEASAATTPSVGLARNEVQVTGPDMSLNLGPQHPSTHGVLRLIVELDGEVIRSCRPVIGYLHRGLERMLERRMYRLTVPFTDRLDYLASLNNNLAISYCIEKLGGLEIPERAKYVRVLLCEMNRIASHLVFLGTFATDIGATTVFLYAFRERERMLDLLEAMTGARLTYNWIRPGGVPADLPEGYGEAVRTFLKDFLTRLDENDRLLTGNRVFRTRCEGVGLIPPETAIAYGASGPVARGSGIPFDLRKHAPYDVYDRLDFDIVTGTDCDVMSRYKVRIKEMRESAKIIEQCLRDMPEGDVMLKFSKVFKPPMGEAYARTESPRGELTFFMVSDGSTNPARVHIRAPSFVHLSLLPALLTGAKIADLVAILGSLDTVLGEVDR